MKFQCQMLNYDGPEEWKEIDAFAPDDAASSYAEFCDSSSGGELLREPTHDKQTIVVKPGYGEDDHAVFEITVDYEKIFYATDAK